MLQIRHCWLACICLSLFIPAHTVYALDVNRATRAQLRSIKGVGEKLADRILAARQKRSFSSMEDLAARVSGIGPAKLKKLREQGVQTGSSVEQAMPHSATVFSGHVHGANSGTYAVNQRATSSVSRATGTLTTSRPSPTLRPGLSVPAMPMLIQPRPRQHVIPKKAAHEPEQLNGQ